MVTADIIKKYFPDLTAVQEEQFAALFDLYSDLNAKINVISRKDMDNFYLHHVLHSLALAKFFTFRDGLNVIDIGTGGGFPAIPLAILYPNIQITACDSIAKKITVVNTVASELKLTNIVGVNSRVEQLKPNYDLATARAVAPASELWYWMYKNWKVRDNAEMILLKGGDLTEEFMIFKSKNKNVKLNLYDISEVFEEDFFETKKVVRVRAIR